MPGRTLHLDAALLHDPKDADDHQGDILCSFQLLPVEETKKLAGNDIRPPTRDCEVEVNVVGLREVLPVDNVPLGKLFVEVDLGDRSSESKVQRNGGIQLADTSEPKLPVHAHYPRQASGQRALLPGTERARIRRRAAESTDVCFRRAAVRRRCAARGALRGAAVDPARTLLRLAWQRGLRAEQPAADPRIQDF